MNLIHALLQLLPQIDNLPALSLPSINMTIFLGDNYRGHGPRLAGEVIPLCHGKEWKE